MKYRKLSIKNFKSVDSLIVTDIQMVLILVGQNNAGKSAIIDGIKILSKQYELSEYDFNVPNHKIKIAAELEVSEGDLKHYYERGVVSRSKDFNKWLDEFSRAIPSFDGESIQITCQIYPDLKVIYGDGINKLNPYIEEVLPKIYLIGDRRDLSLIEGALLDFGGSEQIEELKNNLCMFDKTRPCNNCFNCIGLINQKLPEEMTVFETVKLLQYKLYQINLKEFMGRVNDYFKESYSSNYHVNFDMKLNAGDMLRMHTTIKNLDNGNVVPISKVSGAMRSIYVLSMFRAYNKTNTNAPFIIIMEEPEIHLHPELQKGTSEILYNLSRKNQVVFSTHSPNMLFNFSNKHIRQVRLDKDHHTIVYNQVNLNYILEDLGYNANDFLNIDFAMIVEGKDDIKRFKMILERFYVELADEQGEISRVSLIPTHSCTNIKTYANLKYINRTYLKDNFLMVRDSDGKDPEVLVKDLCSYYFGRRKDDETNIPRITPENVLVLKYYSLENYFVEPDLLVKIGLVESEEAFYELLFDKFDQYLYRIKSGKKLLEYMGRKLENVEDIKAHFEDIKVIMRGHNLFDIFYRGLSKDEKNEKVKEYLQFADRGYFEDILEGFERFVYFRSKRRGEI